MGRSTRLARLQQMLPSAPETYLKKLLDILPFISDEMVLAKPTKHQRAKVNRYHKLILGDARNT
jgi:hypothetical protein